MSETNGWRWFAAEFAVVVTGVLVALAIQAVVQDAQDHKREREYLAEIANELNMTSRLMLRSDSAARAADSANVRLLRAYRVTNPDHDSIYKWLSLLTVQQAPRPIFGTMQALVNSGDLRLIRDDSIRAALPLYLTRISGVVDILHSTEDEWQRQRDVLEQLVDLRDAELHSGVTGMGVQSRFVYASPVPVNPTRAPFPINIDAMLRDQRVYHAIDRMAWAKYVVALYRHRIIVGTDSLRARIDAKITRGN